MSCFNCGEINRVERGEHPWAVAELATGYVWMNSVQYFEGATFFVSRWCVAELFELPSDDRTEHLIEMTEVAGAVHDAFGSDKMNYEALGNTDRHLHWWLTPRRESDPRPRRPIFEDLDFLRAMWTKEPEVADHRRQELRAALMKAIEHRGVSVIRSFL